MIPEKIATENKGVVKRVSVQQKMNVEPKKTVALVQPDAVDTKLSNAGISDFNESEIQILKNTVAKGTTNMELAYFLGVAKSTKLNPFVKEIWCYKDGKGNLLVFAGRDGFLAAAQKSPSFDGLRSAEIRENDEFEIDIPNGVVFHKVKKLTHADRGKILGAYAIVFRKGGEPTVEFADFETYNKARNTWISHPAEMIKKTAEVHALKKAFGISGIQCEDDFTTDGGVAMPINTEPVNTNMGLENAKKLPSPLKK